MHGDMKIEIFDQNRRLSRKWPAVTMDR